MAAAARQGLPVLYAGGHGTGPWGDVVRAALAAEGIGLLRPADPDRDTGFDVALVEPDAERTFVTQLGAEAVRGPGGWDGGSRRAGRRGLRVGLRPGRRRSPGRPSAAWAAALPAGVLLFLDPGPLVAQIPAAVLRSRPVPLRLAELQPAGGRSARGRRTQRSTGDPAEAARRLLARGAAANVIVRAGAARLLRRRARVGRRRPRAAPRR